MPSTEGISWRCRFGFHPWGHWEVIKVSLRRITDFQTIVNLEGQMRECAGCRLMQTRRVF